MLTEEGTEHHSTTKNGCTLVVYIEQAEKELESAPGVQNHSGDYNGVSAVLVVGLVADGRACDGLIVSSACG